MPIPSFSELRAVDVRPHTEKRDKADYLNWAKCKALLHENGAEKVFFTPVTNGNGSSLFMSDAVFTDKNDGTNRCYEVRVHIVIDELEFDYQTPVMNGSSPVKDNSMSQQRVWNAQTRAFVKGVAIMTGLGFDLWLKEDDAGEADLSSHKLWAVQKRIEERLTFLTNRGMNFEDILSGADTNRKTFERAMGAIKWLGEFETAINSL